MCVGWGLVGATRSSRSGASWRTFRPRTRSSGRKPRSSIRMWPRPPTPSRFLSSLSLLRRCMRAISVLCVLGGFGPNHTISISFCMCVCLRVCSRCDLATVPSCTAPHPAPRAPFCRLSYTGAYNVTVCSAPLSSTCTTHPPSCEHALAMAPSGWRSTPGRRCRRSRRWSHVQTG